MAFTGKFLIMAHHSILLLSIPLILGLIRRDGGLRTLCHSCRLACQQRVLKTFPGFGYFCSKDEIV